MESIPLAVAWRGLRARSAVCVHCGSRRIRLSGRSVGGHLERLRLVAHRCEDCWLRFPLPRRLALSRVAFVIDPAAVPGARLKGVLQGVFEAVPGGWRIEIQPMARGCLVRVDGSHASFSFALDPESDSGVGNVVEEELRQVGVL